jgi:hypothetical protein
MPVDVNVVRTVLPFPVVEYLSAYKPHTDVFGTEACYTVPTSYAYLKITRMHFEGGPSPASPDGPFRYQINVKRGESAFPFYLGYVTEADLFRLYPSPVMTFSHDAEIDSWLLPGDQLCMQVTGSAVTATGAISVGATIFAEGY